MIPVTSGALESIGYNPEARTMVAVFVGGSTYEYAEVSPETFAMMQHADRDESLSVGRVFQDSVRALHQGKRIQSLG